MLSARTNQSPASTVDASAKTSPEAHTATDNVDINIGLAGPSVDFVRPGAIP